jgi:hypothetical protein
MMGATMAWQFQVAKGEIRSTRFQALPEPDVHPLADSEALLDIESFALTANNTTYADFGDKIGYWAFFPAVASTGGDGVIPVWGFAKVIRSRTTALAVGQRVYGFWPMATHVVVAPTPRGSGFVDAAAHRAGLPAVYNHYTLVGAPDAFDGPRALLQPLVVTAFLVDQYLSAADMFGAKRVILSSASSKTALSLAWLLKRRGVIETVGLTSNVASLAPLGCYDRVIAYGGALPVGAPSLYIDFAGNRALTARVHATLGADLIKSIAIGTTHRSAEAPTDRISGPRPEFFFAPTHAQALVKAWGPAEFEERFRKALMDFIGASPWLKLITLDGRAGLESAYRRVLDGPAAPTEGLIVRPNVLSQ